ncbi:tetratricopeptide repeat protein [Caenispirillum bisanense]|uniref:Tetratricopeptide repeat-containing protein n=1 Tax=Caenispirillum bisanense TaxID=414052 RepID=A0A286GT08_9PROT|nr:tetratricopeptide repeat protein [Caenispirillum bisanense]SOD98675.1 Tetratricopeptide repeat-containing protein [Caenispirillum bisanense]
MNLRNHLIAALLMVIAVMAGAFLLIPGERETALMYFRDKEFEQALDRYEAQVRSGNLSPTVIMPLANLYLQYGRVESAVALLERYVEEHPDDLTARRQLGVYYMYAQRPDDYLMNLEQMTRVDIGEDQLRELSRIYNFRGDIDRQVEVLEALVRLYPDHAEDFLDLARLQANLRRFEDAAATLEQMASRFPETMTGEAVLFRVYVLLDAGESRSAFAVARQAVADAPAATLARVAGELSGPFVARSHPELALELLAPHEAALHEDPRLLALYMRLLALNGRGGEAFAALHALWRDGTLPQQAVEPLLELAVNRREVDVAFDVVARTDVMLLADWLMVATAEMALSVGRHDVALGLVEQLGEDFLQERPVLAARLAVLREDGPAIARWIGAAERRLPELDAEQRVDLATLYGRLDRRGDALALLGRVVAAGDAPADVFARVARLYVTLDAVADGLAATEAARRPTAPGPVDAAWAALAAAAGREDEAVAWLDGLPDDAAAAVTLREIHAVAADAGAWGAALAAAERLYRLRAASDDLALLTRALVMAAYDDEALAPLRPLLAVAPPPGLVAAVADRLREAGADRLAAALTPLVAAGEGDATAVPALSEAQAAVVAEAAALIAGGRAGAALPLTRPLATAGEAGAGAYLATVLAATNLGRSPLHDVLQEQTAALTDPNVTEAGRQAAVATLVQLGAFEVVLPLVETMAADMGGSWLYVFVEAATRVGAEDRLVAFLQRELDRSDLDRTAIEERLYLLTEHGGDLAVLPALARYALELGEGWIFTYEDTLQRLGRVDELAAFLERRLGLPGTDAETRRGLAFRLLDLGRKKPAEAAFRAMAAAEGPEGDNLRQLLYLWGPRPAAEQIEWLRRKAVARPEGPARGPWMRLLADLGQPHLALGLVSQEVLWASDDADLLDTALAVMAAAEERATLAAFVTHRMGREPPGPRLHALARRALTEGLYVAARHGYERLLAVDPSDRPALRGLGHAAYLNGAFDVAMGALAPYLASETGTWEDNFYMAEMLQRRGETVAARGRYVRALEVMERVAGRDRDYVLRRSHALLLHRAGRSDAGIALFRTLLEERPDDQATRAELLAALLETRRFAEAAEVMRGRQQDRPAPVPPLQPTPRPALAEAPR